MNETAIGMTMPSAGVEYTRFRCPPPHFHLNQAVGIIHDSKGAQRTGYLDEVRENIDIYKNNKLKIVKIFFEPTRFYFLKIENN